MIPALDVSQFQGTINWVEVFNSGKRIALIKMSGGDAGLYMDSKAAVNYNESKAAGFAVAGYHFIGWVLGASAEASYFLQAMSPLAENDVYLLDCERGQVAMPANAVEYTTEMVNYIHSKINVYPILYMSVATLLAYDWSPLLKVCGLVLADWNNDPQGTIPNVPIYIGQQYTDAGSVPGISGNVDLDDFFLTLTEFNAYGYHAPIQTSPTVATVTTTSTPSTESVTATPVAISTSSQTASTSTTPPTTDAKTNTTTETNTPIEQVKASTLEKQIPPTMIQKVTTNKSSGSWWARLINYILVFIGVRK